MEKIIQENTRNIRNMLENIIDIVMEAHECSKKVVSTADGKMALSIFEYKSKFDKKFILLESEILFALTKKPLAIELRRVITYLIISKELETIINYSKKMAKFTIMYNGEVSISSRRRIRRVHKPLREMIKSLKDLINFEIEEEIISISEIDNEIDEATSKIRKDIVNSVLLKTDKKQINERIFVLNIVNSLERAGDHVVSICENILYIKTNTHIKL